MSPMQQIPFTNKTATELIAAYNLGDTDAMYPVSAIFAETSTDEMPVVLVTGPSPAWLSYSYTNIYSAPSLQFSQSDITATGILYLP